MAGFTNIWRSKQISYRTKISILNTCVFSVALYACETWSLKKTNKLENKHTGAIADKSNKHQQ